MSALVYLFAVVLSVVISGAVRLLWVNSVARREWERLERLTRDDTPRRAPRHWVKVEWPDEDDAKRAKGGDA